MTALPSDWIIAKADAFGEHVGETRAFNFPSRGEWLRSEFFKLKGQPDWKDIQPCSPHALYRVALAFECSEVQTIALDRIVRSLTVRNVNLSPFSRSEPSTDSEVSYIGRNGARESA